MSMFRRQDLLWKGLPVFFIMAFLAGGFFWFSQSSLLAIQYIEVEGNRAITAEQIMETAAPFLRNQSLLKPSFNEAKTLLADIPLVERVDIDRDFPHTIRIRVREHRPLVNLRVMDNRIFVLSPDGKALLNVDKPTSDLPVLSTKEGCSLELGQTPDCGDVITGVRFLANVPVSFNQEFSEVTVSADDINARIRTGALVHFGSLNDYDLKFEVLRQLLARTGGTGANVLIDVSVPERPVTK